MSRPFPAHLKSIREIDLRADGGFTGRYRKYPRAWLGEVPNTIYKRHIHCWLFAENEEVVGTFELIDFDDPCDGYVDDEDFWMLMDSHDNSTMELAEALTATWPDISASLFPYGAIILVDRAWVKPQYARRSEWAAVLRRLIEIEFRDYSVITLKAFPLEFTSKDDRSHFHSRLRALMRLYRRELGMRLFPGEAGKMGWMYSVAPRLVDLLEVPETS
jgi:hypothetical protein